jgi:hypothetical protein
MWRRGFTRACNQVTAARRVGARAAVAAGAGLVAAGASADCLKLEIDEATAKKLTSALTRSGTQINEDDGVLPEYRTKGMVARSVRSLVPSPFFGKELDVMGVPVRAHASVTDAALIVAGDRLSRMLRNIPTAVHDRLRHRGAAFHIIGVGQVTSDLPEHRHMKGVDGGYTGEKGITLDQRTRGMGGVQSSCGEENLIDLDSDPRYAGRDILTHEFAHCIMDVGLPRAVRDEILATHQRSVDKGRWQRADGKGAAYAGSNASEYFAELTMWYFGSHGEFVDREKRLPTPGPGGLAEYDPDGFQLLSSIYGGTHPGLAAVDPPGTRLGRLDVADPSTAKSVDEPEDEAKVVSLEFDNRGCDCAWKLFWLDEAGVRRQYGEVPKDVVYLQMTFPGHVWQLEAAHGASMATERELRYAAKTGTCVAPVRDDSRCQRAEVA